MEEEWRVFLSQNAPELYEEMLSSVKHAAKWRDDEITRLRAELEEAKKELREIGQKEGELIQHLRAENAFLRTELQQIIDHLSNR